MSPKDVEPQRRLPAEWEPQSGVQLTWPRPDGSWADNFDAVEQTFVAIARAISQYEIVLIGCNTETHRSHIQQRLQAAGVILANIRLLIVPSDDSWARDHGPITVLENNRPRLIDFDFNGWGNQYPAERDNQITARLSAQGAFGSTPVIAAGMVLEGGSIDSNGHGYILTTRQCLLNAQRNPGLSQPQIEQRLKQHLGIDHILWLQHGLIAGDDTDGHVDMLARFCDAETIAYTRCDNPADIHYGPLQAMAAELAAFKNPCGQPFFLQPLPLPAPIYAASGQRLPASYANFLIINGAVLVPTYNDPCDAEALALLQSCFPQRDIIAIDAQPLIRQFGSLHCVTMQLPQGVLV